MALYRKLPSRAISRVFGQVTNVDLPLWMRWPIIGLYSWTFSCNLDEAVIGNIRSYPSVGAFFRRELKPETRPIDHRSELVSINNVLFLLILGRYHCDLSDILQRHSLYLSR